MNSDGALGDGRDDTTGAVPPGDDALMAPWAVGEVLLEATRRLLWIKSPVDARSVARELIAALGGSTVLAKDGAADALPIDVSFGAGEPELPFAVRSSVAMMLLERHIAAFVEDAHRAVALAGETERFAEDAAIDVLTGLPNRRSLGRFLGRLVPGDVVIMLDLDFFKQVNDTEGHDAGDRVLRAFGTTLSNQVRGRDRVGRWGGEEFVVVLSGDSDPAVFLTRLRSQWEFGRPIEITFSAGIAVVDAVGDSAATLAAADRAMYRAKNAGRDQWCRAGTEDSGPV